MTLHVQTARISYSGPDRLEVTRRVNSPLAPSWALLRATQCLMAVDPDEAWRRYMPAYKVEMRQSYREHRTAWDELLAREHVVLCCYCVNHLRCHRTLLAGILVQLGAVYDGEVS